MQKTQLELGKAVIEKNGRYLLFKREPGAEDYQNLWDFVGGRLDPGETPADAAARETLEESALEIVPGPEVKTVVFEEEKRVLTFHYFTPESFTGTIALSSEHTDYRWFTKEEINNLDTHPSVSKFFK